MAKQQSDEFGSTILSTDDGDENTKEPTYTTWPDLIRHWPLTTFCIVSNEFCERFSFYGMRTVLTLYILNVLKFDDRVATVLFNGFTVFCYLTPLAGAIIADGYIGMFWTILLISFVYAGGQIILAVASIYNSMSFVHPWLDLLGLAIIAIGTGGIKPCVAPFGADQFNKNQVRMIALYFSMFYFSINAGSLISTFISPMMRSQSCLGQDSCYPLAFGIPAVLMIIATGIFALGSYWYKKPPVKNNVFGDFAHTVRIALRNKFRGKRNRDNWLEHYMDTHECSTDKRCLQLKEQGNDEKLCQKAQFVDDVKSFFRVLIMYLPVPIFWSLYDQQGSVWTIQALQMNCRLWGNVLLLPDQMQTMNAALVLIFIPIFQVFIYPLIEKCINFTMLRKMVCGGVLAALSFMIAAYLQVQINRTLAVTPEPGNTFVSVMNTFTNCTITIQPIGHPGISARVPSNTSLINDENQHLNQLFRLPSGRTNFQFTYDGEECTSNELLPDNVLFDLVSEKIQVIVVSEFGAYLSDVKAAKPTDGNGEFGLMIHMATSINYSQNLALCRTSHTKSDPDHPCDPRADKDFVYWETDYDNHANDIVGWLTYHSKNDASTPHTVTQYTYKSIRPGRYGLFYMYGYTPKSVGKRTLSKNEIVVNDTGIILEIHEQGGVFLMVVDGDDPYQIKKHIFQVTPNNIIKIIWQMPQYVVISIAEILFSVTGNEFAYSQAAPSMKSIVQALWLLTSSIGDTLIVIIALWNPFKNVAWEMLAYAILMLVVIVIFALLSMFYYEYSFYVGGEDSETRSVMDKSNGDSV